MSIAVTPLSTMLGAEITGADLSKPLEPTDFSAIEQALTDHLVVVVRRQALDPAQLLRALRHFGDIMQQHRSDILLDGHPEIAVLDSRNAQVEADGQAYPDGSRDWHTDHTNHARPPKVTSLYAIKLPGEGGGDTGFANMHAAFDALPAELKAKLTPLKSHNKLESHAQLADMKRFGSIQTHPIIRTHPVTGRKAVYIHPGKAVKIDGMNEVETSAFIDELMPHLIKPEFIYRHKWKAGDLVLWDNRSLLHIAYRDYDPRQGRVMHRVLLQGEVPV